MGRVIAVAACALVTRIVWLFAQGRTQITWDGAEYARVATNLLHGHGYTGIHGTTMYVFPPFYSLTIAALLPIVHNAETAGIIVSLLAGSAVVLPVYAIAKRMYGEGAGLIAGTIIAFLPFAVDMSVLVLSDTLFLFLAATAMYLLIRTIDEGRVVDAGAAGAMFGLAYLTRPEGMVLGFAGLAAIVCAFILRPELRRKFVPAAGAFAVLLALVASPYVYFLSSHAGSFQIEAKSAINATIAEGMRSGLSYTEAADAVDDKLNIVGPELDDEGYFTDRWVVRPTTGERISLMMTDGRRRLADVPRKLITRPYGTPLLAIASLVGLVTLPWTRRRAAGEIALFFYVAALFVSLTTVYHFWDRYAFGFTPIIAVWAGHGLDVIGRAIASRLRLRGRWPTVSATLSVAVALLFLAILPAMRSLFQGEVNSATPLTERDAGTWIAAHDPNPGHILTVDDQLVYYANGEWSMLPYVPHQPLALAYVREEHPDYLVLDRFESQQRPYIAVWLAHGVPDSHAHLVHVIGDPKMPDVAIYRWSGGQAVSRPSAPDEISLAKNP
jgi:hypothetical protein